LRYLVTVGLVYAGMAWFGGWVGVAFMATQSLMAFMLLELINYLEHYGLVRERTTAGHYEKVTPRHSWNSAHRITGWYLFNLPRHADHHHVASRPYWKLQHVADSPQLPAGYATMLLCALVPPLWRRVMDPRVRAWQRHGARAPVELGTHVAHAGGA
jgi:alkane 1-monooxygenase